MKVYIADNEKLSVFSLPNKIEDEFVINYTSPTGIEEIITLTTDNNNWNIATNQDMRVYNDTIAITKEVLTNNSIYKIKFSDLENFIMLYCFDTPIDYYKFALENKSEITLGREENSDIIYDNQSIYTPHLKIYRYDSYWIYEDTQNNDSMVYLNQKRCHKAILSLGDTIFTNGLKLIWMNEYVVINNPNNKVKVRIPAWREFDALGMENRYTPVNDAEKNAQLYTEKQVFFHTPRLRKMITEKTINIERPPEEIKPDDTPAILIYGATIMMGLSSSITGVIAIFNITTGKATLLSSITEIFVCVAILSATLLFPMMQDKYQKRKLKKREQKRQSRYNTYLAQKTLEIENEINSQREILFKNNLSVTELQNAIINKTSNIWSREIPDSDFLTLRLGLGTKTAEIKIEATLEEFNMEDDNLKEKVKQIKATPLLLQNVPITISLIETNVLPIIISEDYPYRQQYIDWLSLQLITYYSGIDLKIVILTTKDNEEKWECFKYLPHCYSNDRQMRLFATNEDELKVVASHIENEYNFRKEGQKNINTDNEEDLHKLFDQYYLIITDNYIDIKGQEIIKKILNTKTNLGFSLCIIESTMSTIPSRCKKFIDIKENSGRIYNKDEENQEQIAFIPEIFNQNINAYSRIIANIPAISLKSALSLPPVYNFLEMYKVGKIEQLNIMNRWEKNDPTTSLHTPLGIKEDGKLLEIDLHEKYHGPHGLIAGSTGSGKSEFIITFILSMAINYHPYEVQFVLIDYKGGGLAGAFENKETGIKIPHLVGTITNLDTNEMHRTLVSINSELKRRERIFNEARDKLGESTVDIYKYQRFYREGRVKEPVSHLFIISDEFAELKAQQPDFMDELVSTARIGRSLGVHLILATQKPAGVVDDQIWSNSRFKICLKVQTTEDSNELLKRPEAAMIKETGRFYLQVGYDELFVLAQSAWAGAKYNPTDRILKSIDDSIDIIDNNGNIVKRINNNQKEENMVDYGDQLTNIVKYLYNVTTRENIKLNSLWLPSIPQEIYLSDIVKKYQYTISPYQISPIIGEYDDPSKQFQGILTVDLTNTGNLMIYGNPGSGKENLLTTIIYSTIIYHTTEEVNFYLFDFGAETLKIFNNTPQVGDVVLINEEEKIKSGLLFFSREIKRRKELFSEYGGNYSTYIKTSNNKLPLIVVIINSYEPLIENYMKYSDYLSSILRDSSKYGIVFIATVVATNSIGNSIQQNFNNKIAMQLNDDYDYKYTFMAPYGLVPAKCSGRGIITLNNRGYEFQTAYIYNKDYINDVIRNLNTKLQEKLIPAKKIPVVPKKVTSVTLSKYIDKIENIPIGIDIHTAELAIVNLEKNKIFPIVGNNILQKENFLNNLIEVLKSTTKTKTKIIDFASSSLETEDVEYIFEEYTAAIKKILEDEEQPDTKTIYLILGIGKLYDNVLDEGIELLYKIFSNIENIKNCSFIIIDNYTSYKKITNELWYQKRNNIGIWYEEDIETQNIFDTSIVSRSDLNEDFPGLAYYFDNNSYQVIKSIGITGEEFD